MSQADRLSQADRDVAHVFVLGADDLNLGLLRDLSVGEGVRFHPLLHRDQLLELERLDLPARLADARRRLQEFDGSVDAIVGYWDFPVSSMVPILCRERGLPGPDLEGVLRSEHKYWSRLEQAEVIEEHPAFGLVSLDEEHPAPPEGVDFPMWLKPVKSVSSQLAFRVEDRAEFDEAVEQVRGGIDAFSEPFDQVLQHVPLPPHIDEVGSRACLAEEAATGRQMTVEGYCLDDEPHVYGVVETVLYEGRANFQRYEYPAPVPRDVEGRLAEVSTKVMRRMGIGSGTFNIEYFWDPGTDRIRLLEVNPRHSQAHAEIFQHVDGAPNHRAMVQIGLGRDPSMPHRQGEYAVAAKFFLRVFHDDGVVTRAPGPDEVARIEAELPGVSIDSVVEEGTRLSDLPHQDPYSYVLADVVVGAEDRDRLLATYDRCVTALGFEVEPREGDESVDA